MPIDISQHTDLIEAQACLAAYAALGHVGKLVQKRKLKGKSALILGGSGGVGTFAVQLAKNHFGCFVMASCSAANADLVKDLGADEVHPRTLMPSCAFRPRTWRRPIRCSITPTRGSCRAWPWPSST